MSSQKILSCPIRYALVDLSGTLHVGENPIDGAVPAIRKLLSQSHVKVLFLTNTTTVSAGSLYKNLMKMGFPSEMQIMMSAHAVRQYISQHNLRPYCLVEPDMLQDLGERGQPSAPDKYDSVLVGLSPSNFQYDSLNQAFQILQKQTVSNDHPHRLLAFHRSKYLRDAAHNLSLGPGGFIKCLEYTTGHEAHILGKPQPSFYQAALAQLGASHGKECVMIGDDFINDIRGARQAGIGQAILVQTGKYQAGDERQVTDEGAMVMPSIVEAVEYILSRAE